MFLKLPVRVNSDTQIFFVESMFIFVAVDSISLSMSNIFEFTHCQYVAFLMPEASDE